MSAVSQKIYSGSHPDSHPLSVTFHVTLQVSYGMRHSYGDNIHLYCFIFLKIAVEIVVTSATGQHQQYAK